MSSSNSAPAVRRWWTFLVVCAALRVAPPVAALAAEGRDLPGLPRFDLVAGTGDDAGFYAGAREFISALGRVPAPLALAAALAAVAAAVAGIWLWSRRDLRPWIVIALSLVASLCVALVVLEMRPSGSAVLGWPLLWALPMLPLRVAGVAIDYELAFWLGFPLALAANVVALVATAYAGLYATGRRAVGLAAAAALAVWPLVSTLVAGTRAWENGTWFVDTGLALYTEPVATALVATALALLLRPGLSDLHLAVAGVLLSYATLVKLSSALVAAVMIAAVALFLGVRRALPLAAGALAVAQAVAAFWPLGYVNEITGEDFQARNAFSLDYVDTSWTQSLLFSPRTLAVLLPLALVGALVLKRRFPLALLLGVTLVNPILYSFYSWTEDHPRFLFASLPSFFVLWALGLLALVDRARSRMGAVATGSQEPPRGYTVP